MSEPLTDQQIAAVIKREYPHILPAEAERMARTCRRAKWLKELLRKPPRSVGLSQGLNDTDVEGEEAEGRRKLKSRSRRIT